MFKVETTNRISVSEDLVKVFVVIVVIFLLYFFSKQLQVFFANVFSKLSKKLGIYSVSQEYAFQKYVYQQSDSLPARLYNWVNMQLIALGLKRLGVSVVSYLMFWCVMALIMSLVLCLVLGFGLLMLPIVFCFLFVVSLVLTRVIVSEQMERREADVMDAIDLIVPEVKNGIKNAIITYQDNFAPSVKDDFHAFITNIQDRGYSFEDAMIMLSDSLGSVFKDFAQKAIYYEAVGETEMVEIFNDITETNRLRRMLRDENNKSFAELKSTFVISTLCVVGYFIFLMITDDFSRIFFLQNFWGQILLLIMIGIVFAVLAYITTIKSRAI